MPTPTIRAQSTDYIRSNGESRIASLLALKTRSDIAGFRVEQDEESAPPPSSKAYKLPVYGWHGEEDGWDRVGNVIRTIMALVSLMVLVKISVSEKNPVFLLISVVVAVIFLRFGNRGTAEGAAAQCSAGTTMTMVASLATVEETGRNHPDTTSPTPGASSFDIATAFELRTATFSKTYYLDGMLSYSSRSIIEISIRLQLPPGYLANSQMVEVHHLDIDLSARDNKIRRVTEPNGELILFGGYVLNIVDSIGAGLRVPIQAIGDVFVTKFLGRAVGASKISDNVPMVKARHGRRVERLPDLLHQLLREGACLRVYSLEAIS